MTHARLSLALICPLLVACGAPPPPPTDDVQAGTTGPAATPDAGRRVPSGATLSDTRDDPNPIPEDALVVDQKPWDLDYDIGKFGGNLAFPAFSEPKTFNWVVSNEQSSSDVYQRMYSDLVHVNRYTQDPELGLAKSIEVAPDGLSLLVNLRKGILWSDGQPFTADDVVFTFATIFDPSVRSPQADILTIGEQPIRVEKVATDSVRFIFPQTMAVPDRLLDAIWILPKHKLEASLKAGTFSSEWGVNMKPEDFVTLGPFRLKEYQPGIKTVLERNPHFFKLDGKRQRLPYLDQITVIAVSDWNTERLKFENHEVHIAGTQVRQEDYADLKKLEQEKDWTVYDLGASLNINFMWLNENLAETATVDAKSYIVHPDGTVREQSRTVEGEEKARVLAAPRKPIVEPIRRAWFRDRSFRQAVSHAINRDGIVRSVFYGLGVPLYSNISPGNKVWHNPDTPKFPYDLDRARQILEEAGYRDTDGDGIREDAKGHRIEFTLLTNKGNEAREKMGNIIKDDLLKIGIAVDYKPIDFNSLITKITSTFDYDAGVLSLGGGDVDPSGGLNVWKSSGFTHFWYPLQPTPSTDWEREIDVFMGIIQTSQSHEERVKASAEVQNILSREAPFNYILSVKLLVAARNCVGNLRPAVMDHYTLHNQEFLYFKY